MQVTPSMSESGPDDALESRGRGLGRGSKELPAE